METGGNRGLAWREGGICVAERNSGAGRRRLTMRGHQAAASSAPPPPSGGLVGRVTRLGRVGAAEMSASAAVLRSMVRDEGAMALTRGMSARLVKISVGQALIFGAYDAIRRRV